MQITINAIKLEDGKVSLWMMTSVDLYMIMTDSEYNSMQMLVRCIEKRINKEKGETYNEQNKKL